MSNTLISRGWGHNTATTQHCKNKVHAPEAAVLDAPKPCVAPKAGVPLVAPLDAPKPDVAPPKAEVVAAGAADAPKLLLVAPKAGALIVEPKPPLPNVAGAVPA